MHKSIIIIFLLVGSLVILVPNGTSSSMNIISNAMAIELHPPSIDGYSLQQQQKMYTNTDDDELYKDDISNRNHYYYLLFSCIFLFFVFQCSSLGQLFAGVTVSLL